MHAVLSFSASQIEFSVTEDFCCDLQEFKDSPNFFDNMERMSTERCAKLMVVGMANNLDEVWISEHPPMLMFYTNQYFPNLFRW